MDKRETVCRSGIIYSKNIVRLISSLYASKSMDESDNTKDIILAVILVISTLAMVVRLWQDWIVAVSTGLMMISLAGLILSLCKKIKNLEKSIIARERTMRINLEEVSKNVNQRCDAMSDDVENVIDALSRRVYR